MDALNKICAKCNSALGFFNDSLSLLESGISYLKNAVGLVNGQEPNSLASNSVRQLGVKE